MPPRFTTKQETGKVCSPGCSKTKSTSLPLPVMSQIALPNSRHFLHVVVVAGDVVDVGQLAPAIEVVAVDDALGAELHDEVALGLVGDDADGVGAGGGDELHRHRAEAARGAPDQHVMAGPQDMRAVAEQHAVGGGERQRVAAALLPGQVLRPRHELAVLHAAELGEGAVRRLVAPDALRGARTSGRRRCTPRRRRRPGCSGRRPRRRPSSASPWSRRPRRRRRRRSRRCDRAPCGRRRARSGLPRPAQTPL